MAGDEQMDGEVRNNEAAKRYELEVDGRLAIAEYRLRPGRITFTHTEVPEAIGGRGIGTRLVKAALDDARARGLKVVAICPFVKRYIDKNSDYADLLA
ncbi:MAG TPA: GNAT family N-acetyltransferase [Allosphingosinicella sp.]|nr:GNAT family N-acetyltransferase [Allosphingosinicella sp.]